MTMRILLWSAAGVASAALLACRDGIAPKPSVPAPPTTPTVPGPLPRGIMEITISGLGTPQMNAAATALAPTTPPGGSARFTLAAPANGDGTGDGTIQLQAVSTGSFTSGVRGAGGYRYVWATFNVRNAQSDGTAYNTARANLTFFAVSTSGTIGQSAISSMLRFDGSAASSSIATQILPTGDVYQQNGSLAVNQSDVLQVITEAEASALSVSGASVLPYGFVVRNAADGSRALAASPAAGQYDGVITFAFKIPLQSTAAADPFSVTAQFQAVDDSQTRITESLEEQTTAGQSAFQTRATAIGATQVTLLPGGAYSGGISSRMVCAVRTAGTSASPTAYLVQNSPQRFSSMSPDPLSAATISVSKTTSFSFTTDCPLSTLPTPETFTVTGEFHGRLFGSSSYSGFGTSTISTPSTTFFPGEMVEVGVTSATGALDSRVVRYRIATSAGSGTFGTAADSATGLTSPSLIAAGDLNGDGKIDIVVGSGNTSSGGIGIFLGNGDGTFAPAVTSTSVIPRMMTLADMNEDGKLDLVAYTSASGLVVAPGNGDGTFATPATVISAATLTSAAALAVADYTGDGHPDVIVAQPGGNVAVFVADGSGGFNATPINLQITSGTTNGVAVWQIGNALGIAASGLANNVGSTAGGFTMPLGSPTTVLLGDVNGDGLADLIGIGAGAAVGLNTGTASAPNLSVTPVVYGNAGGLAGALGDVNGDGKLDIVIVFATKVGVLLNNGDGTFATEVDYSTGSAPHNVVAVDVNGDGRLDLVTVNSTAATISILLGQP